MLLFPAPVLGPVLAVEGVARWPNRQLSRANPDYHGVMQHDPGNDDKVGTELKRLLDRSWALQTKPIINVTRLSLIQVCTYSSSSRIGFHRDLLSMPMYIIHRYN
ncbi:hypothetical protein K449DRAFT_21903 [Hypoxylon sp. EC38]|nr:hypothetical protein K449DRAFT_21903 [Hypoxylon sp. EC38]